MFLKMMFQPKTDKAMPKPPNSPNTNGAFTKPAANSARSWLASYSMSLSFCTQPKARTQQKMFSVCPSAMTCAAAKSV